MDSILIIKILILCSLAVLFYYGVSGLDLRFKLRMTSDLGVLNSFENYIAVFEGPNKDVIELYSKIRSKDGVDLDGNDHFSIKHGDAIPYIRIHNNIGLSSLEFAKRVKEKYDVKHGKE